MMVDARLHRRSLACLLALLANGAASAATQGTLGGTSSGSVVINASVPNRIELTGLTDVSLLNQDPTVDALSAQNVCVWSNTNTKGYYVTATGSGTASAFTLSNGATIVPYNVEWAVSSGQSAGTPLVTATALHGLVSTATNPTCVAGPSSSASLVVKIPSPNLQAMQPATTYTGTLTLVVAPE